MRGPLQGTTEESITQTPINGAVGNGANKLPDHLQRPAHWSKASQERAKGGVAPVEATLVWRIAPVTRSDVQGQNYLSQASGDAVL